MMDVQIEGELQIIELVEASDAWDHNWYNNGCICGVGMSFWYRQVWLTPTLLIVIYEKCRYRLPFILMKKQLFLCEILDILFFVKYSTRKYLESTLDFDYSKPLWRSHRLLNSLGIGTSRSTTRLLWSLYIAVLWSSVVMINSEEL